MPSLVERFQSGDAQAVWDELVAAGDQIRVSPLYEQAVEISRETMRRVLRNVELIIDRLKGLAYEFAEPERVHLPPSDNTAEKLDEIERRLGGPLPLSLRAFWEIVGSVDFRQSLEQSVKDWIETPLHEIQQLGDDDPLYVEPFESLLAGLDQNTESYVVSWDEGRVYFCFAPDCFHKAGVSGGENYHVYLPDPAADFRIIGDVAPGIGDDLIGDYFVEYLRRSVLGGGFRGRLSLDATHWLPQRAILDSVVDGLKQF